MANNPDGSKIGVPVGSIVAYCGDRRYLEGTSWRVCDGTSLSKDDFPELYAMIGDANSTAGDREFFDLPDLRGRFLRGWSILLLRAQNCVC
jgi:microcystin-dependent protein